MEFIIASDVSGGYMALPDGNGEGRWVAASLAELAAVAPVIYWDEVGQAIKLDGNGEEAALDGNSLTLAEYLEGMGAVDEEDERGRALWLAGNRALALGIGIIDATDSLRVWAED